MTLVRKILPYFLIAAASGAAADTRTLPLSWVPPSGQTPGPVDGTMARLVTGPEGASMHLSSMGLPAGHAVTIWFVALQNPDLCKKNPCTPVEAMGMPEMDTVAVNGGGTVVSADGKIEVSAHLPAGKVPTNLFDADFVSPETAEYHLVIHDHGPLIPDLAADMLSSFRGGARSTVCHLITRTQRDLTARADQTSAARSKLRFLCPPKWQSDPAQVLRAFRTLCATPTSFAFIGSRSEHHSRGAGTRYAMNVSGFPGTLPSSNC